MDVPVYRLGQQFKVYNFEGTLPDMSELLLLTYLSRLYEEQYRAIAPSADKLILKNFQKKINECYRELHEVGDYASLLHLSAGHLSEVVKQQSGKPAIKHIHERLIMEARRMLFHTSNTSQQPH